MSENSKIKILNEYPFNLGRVSLKRGFHYKIDLENNKFSSFDIKRVANINENTLVVVVELGPVESYRWIFFLEDNRIYYFADPKRRFRPVDIEWYKLSGDERCLFNMLREGMTFKEALAALIEL